MHLAFQMLASVSSLKVGVAQKNAESRKRAGQIKRATNE